MSGIRDKRVDRMLAERGYHQPTIFYSPILIWVIFSTILSIMVCQIAIPLICEFDVPIGKYWPFLVGYLSLAYVVASYLNNSFAIVQNKLWVINPNFPFRKATVYNLGEISNIHIGTSQWLLPVMLFGALGRNYISIETAWEKQTFFCSCLDVDCFDENLTDLNLDDFYTALREKVSHVQMDAS